MIDLDIIRSLPMYKVALKLGFVNATGPRQGKVNTLRIDKDHWGYVFIKYPDTDQMYVTLRRGGTSTEDMGEYDDDEKGYSEAIIQCIYKSRGLRRPYSKKKLIEDIFINGIG